MAVYGVTGKGKSSVFVKPIIFDKADENCVLFVNDMSGDIYQETSWYMEKKGYRIIVFNPHDLEHSHRYNPFTELQHENETIHMAQMFVQAIGTNSKDQIWTSWAEAFMIFLLKCLRKSDQKYNNPQNLYYIFQSFWEQWEGLHEFVAECACDDQFMINEWKSLLWVHKDGILSFIMNAKASLKIFSNKDVCTLTSTSDIDIATLRKDKTIIYFIIPPLYQRMYRPVTSMYFLSFLQGCMRELPKKEDLPVYFLFDEFWNAFLPDFDLIATTVRKYRVSLMIFMQGINQLIVNYWRDHASVILSGIVTQISFWGAEQETAEYFERRAWKVRVLQRPRPEEPDYENYTEYNLINASEIRELDDKKILVISDNRPTTLLDFIPVYKHPKFKNLLEKYPPPFITAGRERGLEFIPLKNLTSENYQ